ncbi:hypothetical protein JMN32_09915 [Fulvivirga sp. 29W222]|uniref:Uncharacterized protein n=1 Tax=Fulvivirga marina TaxID=2494733 RepID=A0A937KBS0_9BACT|nr:hypothetical protein [Fulvivirga marina]MBL6446627.1 hypothetical protein [Fulvivirga marina]
MLRNITHDALIFRGRSRGMNLQIAVNPDTGDINEALLTNIKQYKRSHSGNKIYGHINVTKSIETLVSNASLDSSQLIAYYQLQDSITVAGK